MFVRIIVPIDGSHQSWSAARVGAAIAGATDAELELVNVVFTEDQRDHALAELAGGLAALGDQDSEPALTALVAEPGSDDTVGGVLARHTESVNGAMLVMSSTGRDRSAAVLGSVADDVLRALFGPIIVVGPHAGEAGALAGPIVVPVDGSEFSETSLPLAAAWGIAFGATPWIVEVATESVPVNADVFESSYPSRLAGDLRRQSHHGVEFEVLHGSSPAKAITDFADGNGAGLILMSTHGRSGVQRLSMGSTAAAVVREARCPVVLHRPPHFALD